jgi:chromosomal replication initiator protein
MPADGAGPVPSLGHSPSEVAARITAAFAEQIGAARFHLWFPPNAALSWIAGELRITCRNDHFRDWARDQFGDELERAAKSVVGEVVVTYCVDATLFDAAERPEPERKKPAVNLFGEREVPRHKEMREDRHSQRRWKTFAEFVPGASNRVAAAAAQAVIDEGGLGPNPLVLHGPVGTGKTHLLEAIAAGLRKRSEKPLFLTAEEFTHRFIQSARRQRTGNFRRFTRGAGALLLDDVQFFANKRATQEELLHVLDGYVAEGMPVVVTLDTHPRLAEDLLPELTDRLLGGAAWGLLPPDDVTRLAILKAKAMPLPEDVLKHLARHLTGNVRELEGAIHSLRHYGKVTGEPITLALAKDILSDLLRHTVRAIGLADIDAATCKTFRLMAGTLQSKARTLAVTQPRMLAVYLARKHTTATFGEIAKHFGVRQHSTAIAAEKKVRSNLQMKNAPAADLLARIERELFR